MKAAIRDFHSTSFQLASLFLLASTLLISPSISQETFNDQRLQDSLTAQFYETESPETKIQVLLELAKSNRNDSAEYLMYLRQALSIARENNLSEEETYVTYKLGWNYLGYGDILAKKYFLQLLDVSRKRNDPEWIGEGFNGLGVYYYDSGDIKRSIDYYEKALANYEKAGYVKGFGSIHNNLGISYRRLGDAVKALEHHFLAHSYRQAHDKKKCKTKLVQYRECVFRPRAVL